MKFRRSIFLIPLLVHLVALSQQKTEYSIVTVAFYNLENLFDVEDDPLTFDEDWTPEGKNHWAEEFYRSKIKNLARVISEIGRDETNTFPALVGVSEVENLRVLEDLLNQEPLNNGNYGIIHFDSPDRRGIDVALLFRKNVFIPTHYKTFELLLFDDTDRDKRVYTRDQLLVVGMLDGEEIHVLVNHWPSRMGGEARSRPKRIRAAQLNRQIIDSLFSLDPYAKIITMGDLNDDPTSPSVKKILKTHREKSSLLPKTLYNPMEEMYRKGLGTLAYRDSWNLFDQIILSSEWLKKDYSSYRFYKADIFNKNYLQTARGKYKGYPFRSFSNGFTGGYSDHFPVYLCLIKAREPE